MRAGRCSTKLPMTASGTFPLEAKPTPVTGIGLSSQDGSGMPRSASITIEPGTIVLRWDGLRAKTRLVLGEEMPIFIVMSRMDQRMELIQRGFTKKISIFT